ncbi:hypothetical protein CVT24_004604 [Panaeolus cyanescens]|uniref:Amino acid permease/ SLC12A domain-containing protein n=1 Tax=Panaeolus cyanescens TaxID=181874 RepID=A0A409YBD4_9AGAR|nr:hypothetical protein CVT24_004604 [Panaeolus cyanescens]
MEKERHSSEKDSSHDASSTQDFNPGGLSLEEGASQLFGLFVVFDQPALHHAPDAAGGMGRHLGIFSCTMLIVGRIIGTGIFSTPSSILSSVGSVGASLMLWVLGFALSFCGLFVWLEYGTMFPRSGGEKVYLEAVYKKPRFFVTVIFAMNAILLGFTASGCIVFANNILIAAGHTAERWVVRGIALGVIVFVTVLHGLTPRFGIWLMNALSMFKVIILLFVVVSGWVVLSGKTHIKDPHLNFKDAFAGSSHSGNDYATATFKVLFAYTGWSNVNYVLNEVKNPIRTLKIAGPLGLSICAALYLLANIAYFAAATKDEIRHSGVTVASLFFGKVFGKTAQKALSVIVALSALGNVITVTYSAARVNQELAKEGVPLPFGNKFWASNWPTGKSPLPGLIIHLIPSIIVIIAPPPEVAYPFILDVEGYPAQIINVFIVLVTENSLPLLNLIQHSPYIALNQGIVLAPMEEAPSTQAFQSLAAVSRVLPRCGVIPRHSTIPETCKQSGRHPSAAVLFVFKYELVPHKVTLDDGTVVNVFSHNSKEE